MLNKDRASTPDPVAQEQQEPVTAPEPTSTRRFNSCANLLLGALTRTYYQHRVYRPESDTCVGCLG